MQNRLLKLAQYYLTKGDKDKALKYFEQALALEPDNFSSFKKYVIVIHLDLKHYELVLDKSNKALQKYPAQPILYLINGVALNQIQKPNEAIDILEAGLDYIIDDTKMESDFYNQLSISYTMLNNHGQSQII